MSDHFVIIVSPELVSVLMCLRWGISVYIVHAEDIDHKVDQSFLEVFLFVCVAHSRTGRHLDVIFKTFSVLVQL